jgi:hypothetical protein
MVGVFDSVDQLRRVAFARVEPQRGQPGRRGQRGHAAQRRVDVGQGFDAQALQRLFHAGFSSCCHSFITA